MGGKCVMEAKTTLWFRGKWKKPTVPSEGGGCAATALARAPESIDG